jgi:hypothetical protein
MTFRQKVLKLATELKAAVTVDKTENEFDIEVLAPAGFYWAEGGDCHILVANKYYTESIKTENLWKDLYLRMSEGLENCKNHKCEWA